PNFAAVSSSFSPTESSVSAGRGARWRRLRNSPTNSFSVEKNSRTPMQNPLRNGTATLSERICNGKRIASAWVFGDAATLPTTELCNESVADRRREDHAHRRTRSGGRNQVHSSGRYPG